MIDLRSDTVTRPTEAMLEAMKQAKTGDDVYGEDPTVNELEAYAARLTGKEAALYAITGTQSNLLALLSHCERGHEYIAGLSAHTYQFEGGGAAALGGIQPYTVPFNIRGELPLDEVRKGIKPDDFHFAITRLVCLENTQDGKVLSLDYLKSYDAITREHGLKRHLDGARVFNAAVKLEVPVSDICQYFDTVSICLSKGLACPVGSLLVGGTKTIHRARRLRKMIGGGMRQAGVIAAAGLYALKNNINRLKQDHDNAAIVGRLFQDFKHLKLAEAPETNMLMIDASIDMEALTTYLYQRDIRISGSRWVFHQDISDSDVSKLMEVCQQYDRSI